MTNRYMNHNTGKKNRIFSLMIYITFFLFFILMAHALPKYNSTTIALAGIGPSIYFLEDSWDFGEITTDELPTYIFKFKNIGDEVLVIKGTKDSCDACIDMIISAQEFNPGEEGELEVTVHSSDMIGQFTQRVYVESNDAANPQVTIIVSGFIKEKDKPSAQIQPQPQHQTPFRVGVSYFSQGEYDKAIIEFEKSIELDEDHTESYYYLGQCYLQKGAIEYNNKNILKAYSLFRKANKFAEQAIPQYEKNIENNPEDLNSYIKLGYIYETRSIVPFVNEYNKALEYYLKALDLTASPSLAGNTGIIIYLNIRVGCIYLEKKKFSQAIEYLENAIKISSHNIEAYYYLGLSYDKIGEIKKAREFLSRVIELAPQSQFAQEAEKELNKINKE